MTDHPLWMRYPAISPDGNTIAFEYQGDIYTVPSAGGHATAIVTHDAYDFHPVWSPDGKWIAFASDRNGNFDVYVVPSVGGIAKRLTVHTAKEVPTCFTPDGKSVLFTASRMDDVKNVEFPSGFLPELYSVSIDGGLPKQILTTPAIDAQLDRSGSRILYHDLKGYESDWRKHHKSSVARDVWIFDTKTKKHTKLTTFEGEDRNPVWSTDESDVYYLSEKSGSFNVWTMPLAHPEKPTQITSFEKHPVRFLSIARSTGLLCFGFDGEIYTVKGDGAKPSKISIEITPTEKSNSDKLTNMSWGATEFAVAPNGKEFAFIVRGDVFVASMDYETTKRITSTPEQERNISFSPDGRSLLYSSERDGSWKIYQTTIEHKDEPYFYAATTLKEEPVVATEKETFQPHYSPNGDEVAYLEERTILKVINLKSKETRTIMDGSHNYSYTDGDQYYEWSPDGKWFLVTFLDHNRWSSEVGLVDAEGKKPIVNLTNSGYDDVRPQWSADGKMMYWFSDRQGLRSHAGGFSESDVFGMYFTQAAFDHFKETRQELDLAKEREKEKEKDKPKDTTKKEEPKKDTAAAKKKAIPPITIDLKNIEDRVARLTLNSNRLSDAVLSKDGERLYYLAPFAKGEALWVHKFREDETKILVRLWMPGGQLALDDEGKEVYVLNNGIISKVDTASGNERRMGYHAEMQLNTPEEREYLFEHVWRQTYKKFYVEDMQGVDWKFYKAAYQKFLPYINNNYDFAEMMSEMLGELNASHTGSGYRPSDPEGHSTAALGAFFDPNYSGNGLKIQEIIERGPLDRSGSKITNGTVIRKIDGQEITPAVDYALYLDRKIDKPVLLSLFNPAKDSTWEEIVKPTSRDWENELLYQRWVKSRREEVDSLSHGRIGYVHVRSMGDDSYRHAYSEILGREYETDGMIVDTRFNGGGWLHDELATLLSGKEYVKFFPRHQNLGSEPTGKWTKPSVLIVSESNYSDAHFFPWTYKTLGIGKIVGMPVPGTATAVWWETLQDNSLYFGIPQVGMLDMNGKYLENQQLVPDYIVNNDPESVAQGRDLQLEKAVEVLMQKK